MDQAFRSSVVILVRAAVRPGQFDRSKKFKSCSKRHGNYHNFLVNDFLEYLRKRGLVAAKEVNLYRFDGALSAKVDVLVLNPTTKQLEFFEIKTGNDPQFTQQQRQIYPLAMVGNHVYSTDKRIQRFGYIPGQRLPTMKGWSLYTAGPGTQVIIKPLLLEFE